MLMDYIFLIVSVPRSMVSCWSILIWAVERHFSKETRYDQFTDYHTVVQLYWMGVISTGSFHNTKYLSA